MCGIPYYVHLEEKSSNSYKYYIEEEDDFLLLTISGLEKQIYIGMDIPIGHGNLSYTLQPIVADIVEDIQFLIEDCWHLTDILNKFVPAIPFSCFYIFQLQ